MKTPGFMGAIAAVFGAILVQASGAELTGDEKQAIMQLRELTKKYADYCTRSDMPMPASFSDFLTPAESKAFSIPTSATDPTRSKFELLKPAAKVSNVSAPTRTPLMFYTFLTTAGQRIVAFVDGHVEIVSDADLQTLRSSTPQKSPRLDGQGLVK